MSYKLKRTTSEDSTLSFATTVYESSSYNEKYEPPPPMYQPQRKPPKTRLFLLRLFTTAVRKKSTDLPPPYSYENTSFSNTGSRRQRRIAERLSKWRHYNAILYKQPETVMGLPEEAWTTIVRQLDIGNTLKLLSAVPKNATKARGIAKKRLFAKGVLLANDRAAFCQYPKYEFSATFSELFHYDFLADEDLTDTDVRVVFTSVNSRTYSGVLTKGIYNVFEVAWVTKFLLSASTGIHISIHGYRSSLGQLITKLATNYGPVIKWIDFQGYYNITAQEEALRGVTQLHEIESILLTVFEYMDSVGTSSYGLISWWGLKKLSEVTFDRVFLPYDENMELDIVFPYSLRKLTCKNNKQKLRYDIPKELTHFSLNDSSIGLLSSNFLRDGYSLKYLDLKGTKIDRQFVEDLRSISVVKGVHFVY